ncbi:MAG: recombination regulator RecX [Firmicutes bacterium]|jgi:regulatory protein|nr:recombination regulator RecX [Bacillota bacterium]MDH7496514.1 regulatory protein RecX [Bacillota bacterium]
MGVEEGYIKHGGPAHPGRKAREYALRLLAMSDRTVKELEERLRAKGFPEEVVVEIVRDMTRLEYLDDEKLAVRFAEGCAERRGIGPMRVRAELSRRGVPDSLIEHALRLAFDADRESAIALASARTWLERHGPSSGEDLGAAKRRLCGFLVRRGFSLEVVERALREVLGSLGGPEEDSTALR